MAYRSENDGLRLRIEELEAELDDAKQTIQRLRGEGEAAQSLGARLAGGSLALTVEREIDGELDDADYDEVVDMLARRFPGGQVTVLGRRFNWSGGKHKARRLEVTITRRAGKSYLRIHEPLRQLASSVFGGIMVSGGAGLLTLTLIALKKQLAINPLWAVVPMVLLIYWACRSIYQWPEGARRRELGVIADDITEHIRSQQQRVRIDDEVERNQQAEAEAEAEQAAVEEAEAEAARS